MKLPILFISLLSILHHFQLIFAATSPKGYQDFIKTSCSTTTYPSLCNKYLSSYSAKVKNDHQKLCSAALTVSLQAAKNTSTVLSSFSKHKYISKSDMSVIKDCIYNIKDSVDELKQSIDALVNIKNSANKKFQLATIKTYASAAITDEVTCIDELGDSKVSDSVRIKIIYVILNFERITSNALSLINRIKY